jgi:hypothetical protein
MGDILVYVLVFLVLVALAIFVFSRFKRAQAQALAARNEERQRVHAADTDYVVTQFSTLIAPLTPDDSRWQALISAVGVQVADARLASLPLEQRRTLLIPEVQAQCRDSEKALQCAEALRQLATEEQV